jgi:putative intracellular protease/amidase
VFGPAELFGKNLEARYQVILISALPEHNPSIYNPHTVPWYTFPPDYSPPAGAEIDCSSYPEGACTLGNNIYSGVSAGVSHADRQPLIVKSSGGPRVICDVALQDVKRLDLLMVPGGIGTRREVWNVILLRWLQKFVLKGKVHTGLLSVCTGSAVLSAAGLLSGLPATSNKRAFNWVKSIVPLLQHSYSPVQWVAAARWVETHLVLKQKSSDQTRRIWLWTSSGVAAGMDLAAHILSVLEGPAESEKITNMIEYCPWTNPDIDPFAVINDLVPPTPENPGKCYACTHET